MNKTGHLKEQLADLSGAINSFSSEKVQVIVLERIWPALENRTKRNTAPEPFIRTPHRNGATGILRQLLADGYFDTPRTIGELADFCNANYEGPFYTNQLSGLLLALVNKDRLKREISPANHRYTYSSSSNSLQSCSIATTYNN